MNKHNKISQFFSRCFIYLCIITLSITITSCEKTKSHKNKLNVKYEKLEPQNLETKYYSKALFSLDTTDFYNELLKIKPDFPFFFEDISDMKRTASFLEEFVKDTFCVRLNNMVESKFNNTNFKQLEEDIQSVFQRFNYYYPKIENPTIYYYISGIDYNTPPVYMKDGGIAISLDYYLGNESKIYDYIGMPRYRSIRCQPSYIVRDLAQYLYYNGVYSQRIQKDLLTEMIEVGKMYYFMEAMNPSMPDSVLMGYSYSQMQWLENHEADVWASIVGNDMLYSKGLEMYRTFFGDGPFTQAFSNEAPARLGEYIGLQIIRSYMANNDVSMQELMANDDIQQIFQASQYKPK
ncbi:MAG: hypothetical protein IJZ87_07385 [Bacteroidales bacterium]|nr:hypothetical protein [Bacteroidales bacterium]